MYDICVMYKQHSQKNLASFCIRDPFVKGKFLNLLDDKGVYEDTYLDL